MKILARHPQDVKLAVETADDLWYLHTLLDPNDRCTGESEYKEKLSGSDERAKVIRRRVWVTLDLERTALDGGKLRLTGKVIDGSEEVPRGSYHSFDLTPGSTVQVWKEQWLDFHEEKLQEAVQSANLRTLVVLFDREHALFAVLRPNGYDILLTLKGDVAKKGLDETKTKSFYKEIVEHLKEYAARLKAKKIIAASPSFWKEYLRKELPQELASSVIFAAVSAVEESALTELLRRPELKQALEGERSAREAELLDTLMAALAKDKLAYGLIDVTKLVEEGNAVTLVVSEHTIAKAREQGTFESLDLAMKGAANIGASVHLFSTADAKRTLDGLGGICAVKRW